MVCLLGCGSQGRKEVMTMTWIKIALPLIMLMQMILPQRSYTDLLWNNMTEKQRDNAPVELKAEVADMTVDEYKLFSSVVEAESDRKKGSIEGRVMIAIVILNRVDSKKFPNTITKVIRQRGQFSVVSSGAYKRVGRTKLSDRAVIEAVERKKEGNS